jgi:hypothetical protein
VIGMDKNRYDQARPTVMPAVGPVVRAAVNPNVGSVDMPACPACGGTWLYNVQQIEEERRYRVLGRGSHLTYDEPSITWTVYEQNNLECADCAWTRPMGSAEAASLLDE